jgi:hypothetical protein
VVKVFTRMLDNVVEINGLPLEQQRDEIVASAVTAWASSVWAQHHHHAQASLRLAEVGRVHRRRLARDGRGRLGSGARSGREKGPAPIMNQEFTVTGDMLRKRPEMVADGYKVGDRSPAACCTPSTAATCSASPRWRRTWSTSWPSRRALHASQLDRAHRHDFAVAGQQRQQRHRAELRASLFRAT